MTELAGKIGNKLKHLIDRELMRVEMMFGKTRVRASMRNDYRFWRQCYSEKMLKSLTPDFGFGIISENRPAFTIVVVDSGVRRHLLRATLRSIFCQNFQDWELIVVSAQPVDVLCDASIKRSTKLAREFRVIAPGSGSSRADIMDEALYRANGEWIVFVDAQDRLSEGALRAYANAIGRKENAWLCYGDEACVDSRGRFLGPYFKPSWSLNYFFAVDVLGKAAAFRTQKIIELGGFGSMCEGAEYFDLVLRCVERCGGDFVAHSPEVTYYNYIAESDEDNFWCKRLQYNASAVLVLESYLKRSNVSAKVNKSKYGLRVLYELPASPPLVSLIIPTRNAGRLVKQCIDSILRKTTYAHYEIILVDNGSDEPESLDLFAQLAQDSRIKLIRDDRPFNFSALNNLAASRASGDVLALVNNDIEVVSPGWLDEMVSLAMQPWVGAVGAKLLYPDGRLQHGGVILGIKGVAGHSNKGIDREDAGYFCRAAVVGEYSAVTAACLVVRKSLYDRVGGLNENELAVAYNDVDFCLKLAEIGLQNIWTPYAELYHHESASRGYEVTPDKQARLVREARYMRERWGCLLQNDPFYNPNLTLSREDFSLSWPPRCQA